MARIDKMASVKGLGIFALIVGLVFGMALLIPSSASAVTYTLSSSSAKGVQTISGQTVYGTAAAIAKEAYPAGVPSKRAIVVNYKSWETSLCAAPLAGAYDCPILYVSDSTFPAETKKALDDLNVTNVTLVGHTGTVSASVEQAIKDSGFKVYRLGRTSKTIYGTQMAIYSYGLKSNLWTKNSVFAVTAETYTDALSISPIAFKYKTPIFLVNPNGALTSAQESALSNGKIKNIFVIGGMKAVLPSAYDKLSGIANANAKQMGSKAYVKRIRGTTAYDTSAEVAAWGVDMKYLKWDKAAFARYTDSADALAGSVLQGKEGAPLLVIEPTNEAALMALKGKGVTSVRIFGGFKAIGSGVRADIEAELGWGPKTGYRIMGTSPQFTHTKLVKAYKATGHTYPAELKTKGAKSIEEFCTILMEEASLEGVRPEVVYAMTMLETGWLQSSNAREKCNFCGLGGGGSKALTFTNIRTGLRAQVQHMKTYASADPLANPVVCDRTEDLAKWKGKGFAPTIEELGPIWAGGETVYHEKVKSIIDRVKAVK